MRLRSIDERAFQNHESSQLIEQLTPRGRHKAVSNSRHVDQSSSPVVANDDGIEAANARHEPADHQFLPSIYTILYPGAAPFSGLVEAVLLFSNDSFKALVIRHEQVRRNGEFGTSGGFEFPDERASVLYWNEWHKRRLRLRVR
jgi:hypothetical protein